MNEVIFIMMTSISRMNGILHIRPCQLQRKKMKIGRKNFHQLNNALLLECEQLRYPSRLYSPFFSEKLATVVPMFITLFVIIYTDSLSVHRASRLCH